MKRRNFVRQSFWGSAFLGGALSWIPLFVEGTEGGRAGKPIVVSTWNHGLPANAAAWKILGANGRALDAVEAGVKTAEADPKVDSVGYGGLPDRDGRVTLDACIMDELGNCGSVAFLQHIKHPI
ncbi:hypothetical protein BH24BAC1_BH24BAC1_31240 [soil metagenome]